MYQHQRGTELATDGSVTAKRGLQTINLCAAITVPANAFFVLRALDHLIEGVTDKAVLVVLFKHTHAQAVLENIAQPAPTAVPRISAGCPVVTERILQADGHAQRQFFDERLNHRHVKTALCRRKPVTAFIGQKVTLVVNWAKTERHTIGQIIEHQRHQ